MKNFKDFDSSKQKFFFDFSLEKDWRVDLSL